MWHVYQGPCNQLTSTFHEVSQESLLNVELVWGDDQGSDVRYLALSERGLKSNLGTNLFITKYFGINTFILRTPRVPPFRT